MGRNYGKCALCGKECDLTFEHIPPRAAFNADRIRPVSGNVLLSEKVLEDANRMPWDISGLQYINQQKGMGLFSLCPECNNNTGAWYGDAYVEFAKMTHFAMGKLPVEASEKVGFRNMYPQKIVKQILSMFCSVNGYEASALEGIRKFVMDRDAIGLDKRKFKLCMYFTDSALKKYAGFTGSIRGLFDKQEFMVVSEITAYPFGFLLYLNPTDEWDYKGADITHWADVEYDKAMTLVLPWTINEMNDIFPEYYRSKEEIRECIENNRKWVKENELCNEAME